MEKGLKFATFESLLEVADSGSVDAAAIKSNRSIAAIQRDLKLLEIFFACKMRDKTGKTIKLSTEAEELAKLYRRQRLDFLDFKDSNENKLSSVRIAAGDSLLHLVVLPKLATIQQKFAGCTIHVIDLGTVNILQGLRNFSIDFGILREESIIRPQKMKANKKSENDDESLDQKILGEYKYSIFIPRALLTNSEVSESEFVKLNLPIAMIKSHWGKSFVEMAKSEKQFPMNIRVWCETFSQVARLVRLGGYAGILPRFFREIFPENRFVEFEPDFLKNETQIIVMAWNKSLLKIRQKTLTPFIEFAGAQLKFNESSALPSLAPVPPP